MCKDQYKVLNIIKKRLLRLVIKFQVTKTVLEAIGAGRVPTLTVCNKIDHLEKSGMAQSNEERNSKSKINKGSLRSRLDTEQTIGVSALTGEGLEDMLERIKGELSKNMTAIEGLLG